MSENIPQDRALTPFQRPKLGRSASHTLNIRASLRPQVEVAGFSEVPKDNIDVRGLDFRQRLFQVVLKELA